ncbi:MAG TPA: tetratricopeptide repeat protein [Steroidobacteraceae bacterium]|nr:tetratricopeptide repeat protein [Steroidobacteraceae bacterium]
MKKVSTVAAVSCAAAVAMVLGVATSAMAQETPKAQVSAAAGKELQEAQKDVAAHKWDDALAVLDKVKANPKKNDYDEHVMNEFLVTIYASKKQYQEATGPLEKIIASKFTPQSELKQRVVQAASMYEELKNYDKAIEYANRAIKDGYGSPALQLVVAQSYYQKNDFKDAERFIRGLVDEQAKAGQTPGDDMLQLGLSSALKTDDSAGQSHFLELLVTYHPKPEYWQNLLDGMFRAKLSDRQLLQVYRLAADVGAIKRGSDYAEMAQLALDAGSPGEAVAILNKGFANNVFTVPADKNRNQHLLDSAKKDAAADQPTLAKTEADAANAPNGDKLVSVGVGYFGYGDFNKASKDLAAGLAKGPTKDAADARLTLGIAQLKSGAKEEAVKTFRSVKGDPTLERLAALWTLRAKAA